MRSTSPAAPAEGAKRRKAWPWIAAATVIAGAGIAVAAWAGYERHVEQPEFKLVKRDGNFEIRDYPAMLVAETWSDAARERALTTGFGRLADYIFAKAGARAAGALGDGIAMTAPVLSDRDERGWRTRFVLPARFARADAPTPAGDVTLATTPGMRVAVVRFSGTASDAALARQETRLREWVAAQGLKAGAVTYAFYNSPFVPPPLRRNEVMIALG